MLLKQHGGFTLWVVEVDPKRQREPHNVPGFHSHGGHGIPRICGWSTQQQRMVWAPCPIRTNWGHLGLQLILTGQAHTALPSLAKGQRVTLVRDAARFGQWVRAGSWMMSKFSLGPWQRIKDEPLDIHSAVPFVGGKEAEEVYLLPYPGKGGQTSLPHRGGKQKHVSMITHNGPPDQTIVLPKVASHIYVNRILIRRDKHHGGEVYLATDLHRCAKCASPRSPRSRTSPPTPRPPRPTMQ